MANHTTGAQRYNKRMHAIFDNARRLQAEHAQKVASVINNLSREQVVDILDESLGVSCYDGQDVNDLRCLLLSAYNDHKIDGALIREYFDTPAPAMAG